MNTKGHQAPADPVERRLEDEQGRAALELERVRRRERSGQATADEVKTARNALSIACAALELYRTCRAHRADPSPEKLEVAQSAARAYIKAHWGQPSRPAAKAHAVAALLDAQGITGTADIAAAGW